MDCIWLLLTLPAPPCSRIIGIALLSACCIVASSWRWSTGAERDGTDMLPP
jgi:hypothetical protein